MKGKVPPTRKGTEQDPSSRTELRICSVSQIKNMELECLRKLSEALIIVIFFNIKTLISNLFQESNYLA